MSEVERRIRNPFVRLSGHLSGIAGAISLLSVFKDLVEWRSFFLGLVLWWQAHVTPLAHWVFGWLPSIWPWPWRPWAYDYLIFCMLFGLGGIRVFAQLVTPIDESDFMPDPSKSRTRDLTVAWSRASTFLFFAFLLISIIWPLFLVGLIFMISIQWRSEREIHAHMLRTLFLMLSPFIYFLLFLIVNYALFFAADH